MIVALSTDVANLVVWVSLALGVVGLALNVWALRDARGDLRAVRRSLRNGLMLIQAGGDVAHERRRVLIQVLLLASAVLVLNATVAAPDPARTAARVLVLLVQVAIVEKSFMARRVRRDMMRYDGRSVR